jgi:hypothetical protein
MSESDEESEKLTSVYTNSVPGFAKDARSPKLFIEKKLTSRDSEQVRSCMRTLWRPVRIMLRKINNFLY